MKSIVTRTVSLGRLVHTPSLHRYTRPFSSEEADYPPIQLQHITQRVPAAKIEAFCLSDNPDIQRYRTRAMATLPFLSYLISDNTPSAKELIADIDAGKSAKECVKDYFSRPAWATNAFLERAALAPSMKSVSLLGEMLSYGLMVNNRFDTAAYGTRVQNLPSPAQGRMIGNAMWETVQLLHERYTTASASQLCINIGRDWAKHHHALVTNITSFYSKEKAYFKAITEDILLPAYLAALKEAYKRHGEDFPEFESSPSAISAISRGMQEQVAQRMTAFLTPAKLYAYANRWHINHLPINAKKALLAGKEENAILQPEWYAFIADQQHAHCSYRVLTSQEALSQEGIEMDHCVGGFKSVCKTGDTHIVAGKLQNGERFTLEIGKIGKRFAKRQLVGFEGEKNVTPEIENAALWLLDRVNNGEIKVNARLGDITQYESFESRIGFNPLDATKRESVFQIYQQMRVLPRSFRECQTTEEWLGKTGLGNDINAKVEQIIPSPGKKWQSYVATSLTQWFRG